MRDTDKLTIFEGVFCRSFLFSYEKDETLLGISVKKFSMNSLYDSRAEEDRCYCTKAFNCSQDGVFDISPCVQGAPILVSKPHFLGAPFYQTNLTGLSPDPQLHDGWIKVEPWLGNTLKAGVRFQLNIALSPDPKLQIPFASNLLPLLWLEASNDFGDEQVQYLNGILFKRITILRAIAATLLTLGSLILASLLCYNRRYSGRWQIV